MVSGKTKQNIYGHWFWKVVNDHSRCDLPEAKHIIKKKRKRAQPHCVHSKQAG